MAKTSKTKFIEPKMKFNPGTQKYEPTLPTVKSNKKLKVEFDWKGMIITIIILVIIGGLIWLMAKGG